MPVCLDEVDYNPDYAISYKIWIFKIILCFHRLVKMLQYTHTQIILTFSFTNFSFLLSDIFKVETRFILYNNFSRKLVLFLPGILLRVEIVLALFRPLFSQQTRSFTLYIRVPYNEYLSRFTWWWLQSNRLNFNIVEKFVREVEVSLRFYEKTFCSIKNKIS